MNEVELERRLCNVEDRAKSNTRRIEELSRQQSNLAKLVETVATIAQKQEDMDSDLKEIKNDVKTINARPGKRWEGVVDKIIMAVVGILVAYIAVKIGLA